MKLYFSPGSCSLSPHIALREAGAAFALERVHLGTKRTRGGEDLRAISPKGQVPVLVMDDGGVLTEGPAIVQYIADLAPASGLAPPNGTLARYRLQEWLNFVSSELHKGFGPLFDGRAPAATKARARSALSARFDFAEHAIASSPYLLGERFTVADGYLFTVLRWTRSVAIDLTPWPRLAAFVARVGARPAVLAALEAEGLPGRW